MHSGTRLQIFLLLDIPTNRYYIYGFTLNQTDTGYFIHPEIIYYHPLTWQRGIVIFIRLAWKRLTGFQKSHRSFPSCQYRVRALIPEHKREPRGNRGPARGCKRGRKPYHATVHKEWEGEASRLIRKSEDLPGHT